MHVAQHSAISADISTRTGSSFACDVLPPSTSSPPFPSFLPSFLPSCWGCMATHSHRPELTPTRVRNFYFPSLLRDYSPTFPNFPRARQPAYDTRPKECKLPLPCPPSSHTPDRSPSHLKAFATKI